VGIIFVAKPKICWFLTHLLIRKLVEKKSTSKKKILKLGTKTRCIATNYLPIKLGPA